jgi:hypothetical protein
MRIGIATDSAHLNLPGFESAVVGRLESMGFTVSVFDWRKWDEELASLIDVVLIRSTWDYHSHFQEFRDWLSVLEHRRVPVLNPLPVLKWNMDKHYLISLKEDFGVPIIPIFDVHDHVDFPYVIKPFVSAGSFHTVAVYDADVEKSYAAELMDWGVFTKNSEYMKQPFIKEFCDGGEWSLFFFGWTLSHIVNKKPKPGDFRVQPEFGASISGVPLDQAPSELFGFADHVLASLKSCCQQWGIDTDLMPYIRVDAVLSCSVCPSESNRLTPLLGELELIEPYLYLEHDPSSSALERYCSAVARSCTKLRSNSV